MIRVLLADDHPVFRAGLRCTLDDDPDMCVVGEATTGDEAWACCERLQPDVLLLDLRMPGLSSFDLAIRIRQHLPQVHIVVVTANDSFIQYRNLTRQQVSGYVLKDDAPSAVISAVHAVMRGDSWFSPMIVDRSITTPNATYGPDSLTAREHELLHLLATGASTAQIAALLHLGQQTVSNYLSVIYAKLNVSSRTAAIARAREDALI